MYSVINQNPVARFYYKGNHTHAVRRTVLLIRSTSKFIVGYELREGAVVRKFDEAPIKTYRKNRIASITPYEQRQGNVKSKTTLKRVKVLDLITNGI